MAEPDDLGELVLPINLEKGSTYYMYKKYFKDINEYFKVTIMNIEIVPGMYYDEDRPQHLGIRNRPLHFTITFKPDDAYKQKHLHQRWGEERVSGDSETGEYVQDYIIPGSKTIGEKIRFYKINDKFRERAPLIYGYRHYQPPPPPPSASSSSSGGKRRTFRRKGRVSIRRHRR